MGSGLNLPFYRAPVREILGLEPSPQLIAMAKRTAPATSIPTFIEGSAESIPLADNSIDSSQFYSNTATGIFVIAPATAVGAV